jgi:hypothetical protein
MKQVIWINVAVGFWLVIAAFTQHSYFLRGVRMVNDFTAGVLLLCSALWYLGTITSPRGAVVANLLIGAWLVIAPFALGYRPVLNDLLCGVAVVVVSLFAAQPMWRRSAA